MPTGNVRGTSSKQGMFYLRKENFPGYPTENVRRSALGTRNYVSQNVLETKNG